MTDKELRRLSRSELLELLIGQIEENRTLRERLEDAERRLADRKLAMEKAGTMAEAALALSGVFEAADAAAQQYLESIRSQSGRQEEICREMTEKAKQEAAAVIGAAQAYSRKAHAEADDYWRRVTARAAALVRDQDALRRLVQSAGTDPGGNAPGGRSAEK
ncbi:MAG: hypothetical protein SOX31_12140 [Eubacteriales bacterium]|nr:hypothetical protein [Clostridiales bacterium]MDY3287295.1 hypothetical protein [Eubacteriales bacterium]